MAGVNALVAGLTAGIWRKVTGGEFADAFTKGAAGGLVAYSGRRMAAAHFSGHRLLGRQVGALGLSLTRNASEGRGMLQRLFFPFGPMTLEVRRGPDGAEFYPVVNLRDLGEIIAVARDEEFRLDLGASLSSGVAVFRGCCLLSATAAYGKAGTGRILIQDGLNGCPDFDPECGWPVEEDVLAHEMVHILQTEMMRRLWFDPLEDGVLNLVLGDGVWPRALRPGVAYPEIRRALLRLEVLSNPIRPLEVEAEWIEWRSRR